MKNSLSASIHRSTRRLDADDNFATPPKVAPLPAFARPVRSGPALPQSGATPSDPTSSSADA